MGYLKQAFALILFSFIIQIAAGQDKKYDTVWTKVERLVKQNGLTATALKEVNKIYALAKKENNDAQLIKTLIYQTTLQAALREDAEIKAIADLEAELTSAKEPAASIIHSILAERYFEFFQQHRWNIYDRTEVASVKSNIAGWTIEQFHKKISQHYLASVKNEKLLQQTSLAKYEPILIKGNARTLRPTLFDLLSHRALGYFRNEERDITRPAYAFFINDPAAFAAAESFMRYSFITTDSLSLQHKAITLYQRILAFHAADKNPDAFIDADISRIEFVKQYGQFDNKDSLYFDALQRIINKFPDYKTGGPAYFLIAQQYATNALSYNAGKDTTHRLDYVKAKLIIEKILQVNKDNEVATKSIELLNTINRQQLQLFTEKVTIPQKPFLTQVTFKNVSMLNLRIVQLSDAAKKEIPDRYHETYWQHLTSLPAIRRWSQQLPVTNDYQQHAVEIKIDQLPNGKYLMLASPDDNFSGKSKLLVAQYFNVSNISYVNSRGDYFVLHRESGQPLANTSVQVWNYKYDYNNRKNILQPAEKLQTDNNGFFRLMTRPREASEIRLELNYKNDRLFDDEFQYGLYAETNRTDDASVTAERYEQLNRKAFLFTDRSIYRPGQKVYFKGIVITKDFNSKKSKILTALQSTIHIYNANYEVIDSIRVTTNDFGSFNGSFQLPENVLNGSFRLRDNRLDSEIFFSVEEYKRPKFYVEYEQLKGSYQLGDSVQVTGLAKAFAGNNISGAIVNYRITRQGRFPYPWLYSKWGFPESHRMEITQGVVSTDVNGKFSIRFKAIPDRSINAELEPVFDYRVIATITDINGETRVGEKIIPVSYKALLLNIQSPTTSLSVDSFQKITVMTTNLNGQHEATRVMVQVFRLEIASRMIKERLWPKPDLFIMDKSTFISYFPNDEYNNESEAETWKRTEKVLETEDSSRLDGSFVVLNKKLTEGWYVIEAIAKDKTGKEVKDVRYFKLYDEAGKFNFPDYQLSAQRSDTIEPGGKSIIGIGSAATDVFVIQQINREQATDERDIPVEKHPAPEYQFFSLNKEMKWLPFPVEDKDRGGFGVYHVFVKDNRQYTATNFVSVPWSNKQLAVSYASFRDKTLPGSEEKWKIKINSYKNEKAAVELLASMYDASLDQFQNHAWRTPAIWPVYWNYNLWNLTASFRSEASHEKYAESGNPAPYYKIYDRLISIPVQRGMMIRGRANEGGRVYDAVQSAPASIENENGQHFKLTKGIKVSDETAQALEEKSANNLKDIPAVQPRTNFNETAFFLPDLKTDSAGNIEFGFTIPEALTRWKFQALSHTKELAFGLSTKEIVTQKELMVQPNAPRFLREGDRMELSTKIANLSGKEITGTVQLELFNAVTMVPVDGWFQNAIPNQYFTVEAGQSAAVAFRIEIPYQYNSALVYRFTAKSTQSTNNAITLSDGEEAVLPVLSNSMMVTETMALPVQGNQVKQFNFQKLLTSNSSETLKHHALTVEFTSNPAWYAVQALPYLAEPAIESADHLFNRFYANAIALKIANSSPRIREIFERWKHADTAALLSNLQKNQELKSVLLQETPWVLQAKNETEQKKNLALLFDMVKMGSQITSSINRLKEMQSANGGFVWFKGGPDDRYITQYILTSIGHLKKLDALPSASAATINEMLTSGIRYLDERISEDYNKQLKQKKSPPDKNQVGYFQLQYLYMRSFFPEYAIPGASFNAVNFYRKQSQQYWLKQSRYMQGMIALSLFRTGDKAKAVQILKSLKENSIFNEESGRYWKDNTAGYYWYQAPVETQSLLIEAFTEIPNDLKAVNEMKTWLLKQKQTQNWKTNKATADACYALLLTADIHRSVDNWLTNTPQVIISLGDKMIKSGEEKEEAGTGYFKKTFDAPFIKPEMGNISVSVISATPNTIEMPSWGAVYWQYFERLDKITTASSPLKVARQLFIERNSDRGPRLQAISEGQALKPGDKIKVRIEVTVDRNMEYVHLKDMRASCMEPVNVLSGYKWQGGAGYYETTKDAATHFFISWLPKGNYVFEYPLFVTHTGNFSNGITTIQSLYAPEFASHSEGERLTVE